MAKTYFEYRQLHLGLAGSAPAHPGGPNPIETEDERFPLPAAVGIERIELADLSDYLAKHKLRVIGGDATTWPPTIYTEPMEG